jgi:hypothetical protein
MVRGTELNYFSNAFVSLVFVREIFVPTLEWGQVCPTSGITDSGLQMSPRTLSLGH